MDENKQSFPQMLELGLYAVLAKDIIGMFYVAIRALTYNGVYFGTVENIVNSLIITLAYAAPYMPEIILVYLIIKKKLWAAHTYVALYILGFIAMISTGLYQLYQYSAPFVVLIIVLVVYFKYKRYLYRAV